MQNRVLLAPISRKPKFGRRLRVLAASVIFAQACGFPSQHDASSLGIPNECTSADAEVATDDTSLGFSADDVFVLVEGTRTAPFTWYHEGDETEIVFTATRTGAVQVRSWEPPAGNPDISCASPALLLAADASFVTDDGAFAESWREEIELEQFHGFVTFLLERDVADFLSPVDTNGLDSISIWNTINESADPAEMYGVVEGVDFDGDADRCLGRWNMPEDTPPCDE